MYLPSQPRTRGLRGRVARRLRVRALGALGVRTAHSVGGRGTRRRLVAAVACHAVACGRVTRVCACRGALRDACRAHGMRCGRRGFAGLELSGCAVLT